MAGDGKVPVKKQNVYWIHSQLLNLLGKIDVVKHCKSFFECQWKGIIHSSLFWEKICVNSSA